jgi:hypothetical protein
MSKLFAAVAGRTVPRQRRRGALLESDEAQASLTYPKVKA